MSDTAAAAASAASSSQSQPPPLTPLQHLESHLTSSIQHLYASSLIVEHGVAANAPSGPGEEEALQRLMELAQPKMTMQDINNQSLQKHIDEYLANLISMDRVSREIPLTVPRSVIECVESGHNPSLISQRYIEETKFKHESVRAKVFATKVLHDQLKLRCALWDELLSQEAAAGNRASHILLHSTLDTLKQHQLTEPQQHPPPQQAASL